MGCATELAGARARVHLHVRMRMRDRPVAPERTLLRLLEGRRPSAVEVELELP